MSTTNNFSISTLNNYNDLQIKTQYAVIDSRTRSDMASTTDDFSYAFNETLNITQYVKLIYASVPNTYYNINKNNNIFIFNNNGTKLYISLTVGNYNVNSLSNQIQTAIRNALGNNNFSVTYNEDQNQYVYTYDNNVNGNFYLDFSENDNDLHSFFGFSGNKAFQMKLINGVSKYELISDAVVDMTGCPFISLYIPEIGNLNYKYSNNLSFFKNTYLLPIVSGPNNINIYTDKQTWNNTVFFNNNPLKLKKITVQFFYFCGSKIYKLDLNGGTVSFVLEYK